MELSFTDLALVFEKNYTSRSAGLLKKLDSANGLRLIYARLHSLILLTASGLTLSHRTSLYLSCFDVVAFYFDTLVSFTVCSQCHRNGIN